nr:Rrf2 family transcriptional regulator [Gemmatimonadota bacterium]NIR77653.1 Rrf2 family transcriptional regulator [Gemmatimonadota bacterium]NIT86195.1 Rrf2 family transcriptional regulator [Gemmatimonadota bacterium]NIU30020.1 Rrf2 family transcriptional regulator [Gemmatimonadota bacterium]NIU34984.1 Rrf2 family transcriptional regulator [Gemmatimonadota bacterium]
MLSQTAEYALRAALHLARHHEDAPIRVDDVARSLNVPRNYLSKILHELGKEGVLESTRGPKGGFRLAEPPNEIFLARIVGRFDPDFL